MHCRRWPSGSAWIFTKQRAGWRRSSSSSEKAGIATVDHNIWDDPADAAVVRHYANGNDTVPTVVVGDVGLVNPSTKQLVAHLVRDAPHLLPADFEEPTPGLVSRLLGG